MKIGIDARFLTHPQRGGFKTYTVNLIEALSRIDRVNEYIIYLDRKPEEATKLPKQSNFSYLTLASTLGSFGMITREQISLPRQGVKDRLDVLHSPCLTAPIFTKIPFIVTIHDMIWHYPTRYTGSELKINKRKLMEWYYRVVTLLAVKRAKAVITISNASRKSLIDYLHIPEELIFITLEASNPIFHPIENTSSIINLIFTKFGLQRRFILGLGSADPRKNISSLIKAYAMLPEDVRNEVHLVIVWNHPGLKSDAHLLTHRLSISHQVQFLTGISDEDLLLLYNAAIMFVFPSLEEGFGLPPLEAMACGTPVLAANNSSIPEVTGDAALLFDAQDVNFLSNLLLKVLQDETTRWKLKELGLSRAREFSWDKCAWETLDVYKKISSLYGNK
jgi:glycosyltransferase involved in cell wall biosynthesis